jgi:phenylacetate-CoA ligase
VELVDDNGNIIKENGISGRIIGTNLHRYTFPLIRYISGDIARYNNVPCRCGLHYKKFEQVEGRIQNMIVSMDGRIIPLTALVFGQHLLAFNKIEKMQLYQDKPGEVQVRLIKGLNFSEKDEAVLIEQLSSATNYSVKFNVSYFEQLDRTISGKHKFLIQHLDVGFYNFNQNTTD